MALVSEDGTGKIDAEALTTVEFIDGYHLARGNAAWTGNTTAKEAAARRGTAYVEGRFRARWPGEKMKGRLQALSWPRRYATDFHGDAISTVEVPIEVQMAVAEAALREIVAPGSLTPDVTAGERIVSETIGSISVTYASNGTAADAARPVVTVIDEIVSGLLGAPARSGVFRLSRA